MSEGGGPCGLCGRKPSAGFSSAWEGDKQVWLCHPDVEMYESLDGAIDCYRMWTVYGARKIRKRGCTGTEATE